jgi:uncharacterized protein (TIGR03435 family)
MFIAFFSVKLGWGISPVKKLALLSLLVLIPAIADQPKFGLADVHVSSTPGWFAQNNGGVIRDGRYVHREATMLNLIAAAWSVSADTIGDGPSWLDSDLYDVIGKVPEGTTPAEAKLMLQALLAERFGLVLRKATLPMPQYVLSVGRNGSKLKPANASEDSGCRLQRAGQPKMTGAAETERMSCKPDPAAPKPFPNMGTMVRCRNITMAEFAGNLEQATGFFDHPIVNGTGLKGGWDLLIGWSGVNQTARLPPNPNEPAGSAVDPSVPVGLSSYEAVQRELGLKLVKQ